MKVRDNQRSRVYRSEHLAWSVYDQETMIPLTLNNCQKLTDRLVPNICVMDGRGRRKAWAGYVGCRRVIKLPKWARTKFTVCHEASHWITGIGLGHNNNFAATLLDLIRRIVGPLEAEILKQSYKECRVRFRRHK